jgi:uncharacterized membrane protein YbaN (DUF454 family)
VTRNVRRLATFILGWLLIVLGVVGLALPVLQGVLFILLGFYVLSRESRWARGLFERLRARYPRVDAKLEALKQRFRRADGARPEPGTEPPPREPPVTP